MADYGMRISNIGVDVKTGDDVDMAFSTKFLNSLTLHSGSSGSYSISGDDTKTIPHGLSYQPFYVVCIDIDNNGQYRLANNTISDMDGTGTIEYWISTFSDNTNIYVKFTAFLGGSKTYPYIYIIGSDKLQ